MTADEKEAILVELFNDKKSKEIESKRLNNSIKGLRIKRSRVASQIAGMSQERREAYLSLIGKGKYAEIIMEPTRLKNELMSLERSATELYEGELNLKAVEKLLSQSRNKVLCKSPSRKKQELLAQSL